MSKKSNPKIQKPKLPAQLPSLNLIEEIIDEVEFNLIRVTDCELSEITIEKASFDQMVFKNVAFQDVSFRGLPKSKP